MIEPTRRTGLAFALIHIIVAALASPALACACCTNQGQRNVATVALDSGKRQEIESLRFADKATLFTGEGDVEDIAGITTPAATYHLDAKWLDDRLLLSFRDTAGRTGTLSLVRPNTISVFEVDPRDRPTGDTDQRSTRNGSCPHRPPEAASSSRGSLLARFSR